jgi:hypothetical protein
LSTRTRELVPGRVATAFNVITEFMVSPSGCV